MRHSFLLLLLMVIPGCIHRFAPPVTNEQPENQIPTRLLVIFAAGMGEADVTEELPNLQELAKRGARFSNAQLGFLNSSLSYEVFDSGLFPKHLKHQDSVTRSPSLRISLKKLTAEPSLSNTSLSLPKETSHWITEDSLPSVTNEALKVFDSSWKTLVLIYKLNLTKTAWKSTLKDFDTELGKIIHALNSQKAPTLIVVTSPYGHSNTSNPLGKFTPYLRKTNPSPPSFLAKLPGSENIEAALGDAYLRFWLKTNDYLVTSKLGVALRTLPSIAEIFTKNTSGKSSHYIRAYRNEKLSPEISDHALLLNNMANPESPEIIALLDESSAYESPYKISGPDEKIQKIPLILVSPNLRETGTVSDSRIYLPDIHAMIRKLMNKEITR